MVQSYNTVLAEGSISMGRPQSANSRSRIGTAPNSAEVKVFGNSLYDAGDILAADGQSDAQQAMSSRHGVLSRRDMPAAAQPPPMSPLSAGGSQKFQQQRVLAAQKRMERLQMGGLAQTNHSIAIVSVSSSNSKPGTPKTAPGSPFFSSTAGPMPAPPTTLPGPGGRSYRMRSAGSSSSGGGAAGAAADCAPGPVAAGAWLQGSGPASGPTLAVQPAGRTVPACDADEDLEVETLGEPQIKPGTASAAQPSSPALKQPAAAAVDLTNLALFLRRPAPHSSKGQVLCCIERVKGGMGKHPTYRFHLQMPNGGYQFLLSARKRVKTTASSYVISDSSDDLSRHSSSCVAKLRSNFVGTGFSIYLTGSSGSASSSRPQSGAAQPFRSNLGQQQQQLAASSAGGFGPLQAAGAQQQRSIRGRGSRSAGSSGRTTQEDVGTAWQAATGAGAGGGKREVGAVLYEYNVLGTRGPRKLSVAVPHIDEAGNLLWAPSVPQDSIAERLKAGGDATNHLVVLKNKDPRWNTALNAYCLNFNGRVTEASVKNFQLVTASDPDAVVLQFGKVSDTCFTCDFSWPLTPLQAFSICLSSFDNKLACE